MKTSITKNFTAQKIIIEHTFLSQKAKVWKAWTDDAILIRWWGPKEWPATSKSFDFRDGGHWHYNMTGPDGTKVWGWNDYISIVNGESFTAKDYFCDAEGNKNKDMASTNWFIRFEKNGENTKVIIELTYKTDKDMRQIIDMGFEAGFSDALDNLDKLLPNL